MAHPRDVVFHMAGWGKTRLELETDALRAGQPSNGFSRRTIPLSQIEGFFVERAELLGQLPPTELREFNGNFILAFQDGEKRRVYRMAVNTDAAMLWELVDALAMRRPEADLTKLPPSEALARLRVASHRDEVFKILAIIGAGFVLVLLIVLAMLVHR